MALDASLADLPVPFAPVHLLFINLLTDSLPAIGFGAGTPYGAGDEAEAQAQAGGDPD